MRSPIHTLPPLILVAIGLTACAVPRDGEFAGVAAAVDSRIGREVQWTQSANQDAAAQAAVVELLAEPLTADRAVQISLLNNHALQATYADLGIAQAALVQAGLLRNPVFDAVFRFPEGGSDFGVNLDLGVAFEFLDILFIPLRRRVAESEFEAAKLRVTGQVMDLATETRQVFYDVQTQQQLVGLFEQATAATDASLEAAQSLFEAGNVPQLDLDNERYVNVQARLSLAQARAGRAEARERLNVLMGLWGADTDWQAAPRLPNVPAEEIGTENMEQAAIANSVDLAIVRQDMETLGGRYGVGIATSVLPDFELGGVAERDEGAWEAGPAIALSLPLFDHGQAQRAGIDAELMGASDRYKDLAIRIRAAARIERARLLQARETALYYRQTVLPLQRDILEGTQLHYNAMQASVFQLLQAKIGQVVAGQRYLQSLADYWKARARLDQLLAGRLPAAAGIDGGMAASAFDQAATGGH